MIKPTIKPLSVAIGTCLACSLAAYGIADAHQNPFTMIELTGGYMVAGYEGVCGEGKCGGVKKAGKDGQNSNSKNTEEGKCGGDKAASEAVCGIYNVGSAHKDGSKVKDGKCGGHKPVEMLCGDPR